jgi:nicotinate-nucleotide adenylyltransferase
MRIGVLGGTFDPIHYAHLLVAEDARVRLALDRVLFIPNGAPPHRSLQTAASGLDRLRMAELATASNPAFEVSPIEVNRDGPSYAVETLEHLKQNQPAAELFFIAGIDAIAEIGTWYRSADVVRQCRFVAAARPGYDFAQLERTLPTDTLARITPLPSPHLAISATQIRERLREGLPIRYLTPDPVVAYIAERRLYLPASGSSQSTEPG